MIAAHGVPAFAYGPSSGGSRHELQCGFELGDLADWDQVAPSRAILPQSGIQDCAGRTREHEVALLDAGGEELGGSLLVTRTHVHESYNVFIRDYHVQKDMLDP
jgi:hypothetical protein